MYKVRRTGNGIELFDNSNFFDRIAISKTSWEILQLIKKHGREKAVGKIMSTFDIDEKNAKEDIETVLSNLKTLNLKLEEIPSSVSNVKYAPRTVHFDITGKCNSKCKYCFATDRMKKSEDLSTQQILNIINQLPELGTWLLCLSGGEPFLRNDLYEILSRVEKLELLTQVYTNGLLFTKKNAERFSKFHHVFLQISLDSCIPEHHDLNRGFKGAYEKTLRGIKNLLNYGVIPEVCMILTKYNYRDLEETAMFLHEMGIKYLRIGPALPFSGRGFKNKDELCLNIEQLKSTGKKIMELNNKYNGSLRFLPTREFVVYTVEFSPTEKLPKCGNSRQLLYIGSDGLVYPCIFLVEPQFCIGDAKKETLSKIWRTSSLVKKIRYLSVDDIEKCKKCDVKHLCTGGCRASAYYRSGSAFAHDPQYCDLFNKV